MSGAERERQAAPRVAASSYLNTAPLVWGFARGPRSGEVELVTDTAPARCADMLARGQVEAALVPVIEYQRLPETAVVPGVCVGARREVHSVVLVTRGKELKEVESVALSIESRTSAALVEVIFREFVGRAPRLEPFVPQLSDMLERHDAALVIGDPAMTFDRRGRRVPRGSRRGLRSRARRGARRRRRDRRRVRKGTGSASGRTRPLPDRKHLLRVERGDARRPRTL